MSTQQRDLEAAPPQQIVSPSWAVGLRPRSGLSSATNVFAELNITKVQQSNNPCMSSNTQRIATHRTHGKHSLHISYIHTHSKHTSFVQRAFNGLPYLYDRHYTTQMLKHARIFSIDLILVSLRSYEVASSQVLASAMNLITKRSVK